MIQLKKKMKKMMKINQQLKLIKKFMIKWKKIWYIQMSQKRNLKWQEYLMKICKQN